MKELSLREQQLTELGIMKDIHEFCEKHGIHYFLVYGSLIGAVRHKGFIPWDDDIDICMVRPDYDKFLELTKNGELGEQYKIQNWHNDPEFEFILTRVGLKNTFSDTPARRKMKSWNYIFIDIFPLDYMPAEHALQHQRQMNIIRKLIRFRMNYQYDTNSKLKKLAKSCAQKITGLFFSINELARKREHLATKYNYGDNVISSAGIYNYDKEMWPLKAVTELELAPFEDTKFYIPKDYDSILRPVFGEYMVMPPEKDRPSKHKAYLLEKGDKGYE